LKRRGRQAKVGPEFFRKSSGQGTPKKTDTGLDWRTKTIYYRVGQQEITRRTCTQSKKKKNAGTEERRETKERAKKGIEAVPFRRTTPLLQGKERKKRRAGSLRALGNAVPRTNKSTKRREKDGLKRGYSVGSIGEIEQGMQSNTRRREATTNRKNWWFGVGGVGGGGCGGVCGGLGGGLVLWVWGVFLLGEGGVFWVLNSPRKNRTPGKKI